MRTYLVTGGAGFIGSNYIHYMFGKYDNEIRIINVDALTYAGNLSTLKDVLDKIDFEKVDKAAHFIPSGMNGVSLGSMAI